MHEQEIRSAINLLRIKTSKLIRNLSIEEYEKESLLVSKSILEWDIFKNAKTVAAFFPTRAEANIQPVLQNIIDSKTLLLPRVLPDHQLEFVQINNLERDLRAATFGLMEPQLTLGAWIGQVPDLFLVPGVVFGAQGERIGHGGGYFDRFLPKFPNSTLAGIALSCQFHTEIVPILPHDVRMSYIVSPTGIYYTRSRLEINCR